MLRILEIVSNPRRWPEICWRLFFLAFQQKSIARNVRCAYRNARCSEAQTLRHSAEVAWGLSQGNISRARGYIHVAYRAQTPLAEENHPLGTALIGFDNLRIEAKATDANSSRAYLAGFDEGLTLFEIYRRAVPAGTTAVDVGANIGIHSLVLSRCVGDRGRVYSYEPNRRLCERFRENMNLNERHNITLREVGAGSSDCMLRFQPREEEFNIGLGKFDPNGSLNVEVVRLDTDLGLHQNGKISLIKVDVEGMELAVIRGTKAILAQHRPTLVLEHNPNWTLGELRAEIPYPVKVSTIPLTMCDKPRVLDGTVQRPDAINILVEPLS